MKKGISTTYLVILLLSTFVITKMVSSWFSFLGSPKGGSGVSTKVIVTFSSPSLSEDPRFAQMNQEFKASMRAANIRATNGEKVSVSGPKSVDELIERDPEFSRKLANLKREHRDFERALPNGWRIATVHRENGRSEAAESFILSNTATGK